MSRLHSHPCDRCHQPFACAGEYVRNFDGWPEVVCEHYHVSGGNFRQCEDCLLTTFCDHCGEHPAKVEHDGDRLCLTCYDARQGERASA